MDRRGPNIWETLGGITLVGILGFPIIVLIASCMGGIQESRVEQPGGDELTILPDLTDLAEQPTGDEPEIVKMPSWPFPEEIVIYSGAGSKCTITDSAGRIITATLPLTITMPEWREP